MHPVILFDGVCNFCNGIVDFIIKRDREKKFKFAALQSNAGRELFRKFNIKPDDLDTLILIENGRYYERSNAVLKIVKGLEGIWKFFYIFIILPSFIRNFFYNIIAKRRYKWFGRRDECRVPKEEERERFLEL